MDEHSRRIDLHALRHTALTRRAVHMDLYMLQLFAGHRDPKTTERYLHVRDEQIRRASDQVPPLRVSSPEEVEERRIAAGCAAKSGTKVAPPRRAARQAEQATGVSPYPARRRDGVSEGNRTPDPQIHNLVL